MKLSLQELCAEMKRKNAEETRVQYEVSVMIGRIQLDYKGEPLLSTWKQLLGADETIHLGSFDSLVDAKDFVKEVADYGQLTFEEDVEEAEEREKQEEAEQMRENFEAECKRKEKLDGK